MIVNGDPLTVNVAPLIVRSPLESAANGNGPAGPGPPILHCLNHARPRKPLLPVSSPIQPINEPKWSKTSSSMGLPLPFAPT